MVFGSVRRRFKRIHTDEKKSHLVALFGDSLSKLPLYVSVYDVSHSLVLFPFRFVFLFQLKATHSTASNIQHLKMFN